MTILVTGYTGRVGRIVADTLVQSHGVRPRALVRQAHLDAGLDAPEVDLIAGDLDQPESLDAALDGIEQVFLISPVSPHLRAREAALGERASRRTSPPAIVKVSGLGTKLDSYVDSGRWHSEAEQDLWEMGLNLTALRPPFFMQNLAFKLDHVRETGRIESGIGSAAIAMVDARDIGETAAAVLAGETVIDGLSVPLTGPAALTYDDVATILEEAMNIPVRYAPQTLEDLAANLAHGSMPDWHQAIMLQFNRAFREGLGSEVADTVHRVLGRAPRSLLEWAQDYLAAGPRNPFPSR